MRTAAIQAIASHLPATILTNDELAALYPDWSAEKILDKIGIHERRVAGADETAADLAFHAAEALFAKTGVDRASIDFLLFCTQAPDYILPTSACLLQHRLGLPESIGALDYNLGCSGFVYGLAVAKGLIESGAASRVLLLTADTYSKFIHPMDKSVRTLFGDGAAATLVEAVESDTPKIGPFVFGTDGAGGPNLIVPAGGARLEKSADTAVEMTDSSGNIRSRDNLYMNGAAIMAFTLKSVPAAVNALLSQSNKDISDIDLYVFHQANAYMLDKLRSKLKIDSDKFVVDMRQHGNTVSSSIPLALERHVGICDTPPRTAMLVGFGVGYSWAAVNVVI